MTDLTVKNLTDLQISISRQSKKWAVFDGNFDCVKDFVPYTDELTALSEAKAWCAERSPQVPEIVYPQITKMTVSYSQQRGRTKRK